MMHLMITFITFVFFSNGSFFLFFESSLIYIKERNKVPSADHLYVFLIDFFFSLKQFFFFLRHFIIVVKFINRQERLVKPNSI